MKSNKVACVTIPARVDEETRGVEPEPVGTTSAVKNAKMTGEMAPALDIAVLKQRAAAVWERLVAVYGKTECTLDAKDDAWQLLVAAILAAQCTDARVNLVTPGLFAAFPTPRDFAAATPAAIEPYISSCGLFHNKAKAIFGAAVKLESDFAGCVPQTEAELLSLPGVGRKIANLILGEVFGQPAIVVDTHCGRLSRRLGFTTAKDPVKVEKDLRKILPKSHWIGWGHYMVEHGRKICSARRPACQNCFLNDLCAYNLKLSND